MNISVFMSYSSPYTPQQKEFVGRVQNYLRDHLGLAARRIGSTDYDNDAPLTGCRRLMMECNGLIAIALRRYHITEGEERPGYENQKLISGKYFSSPWTHIETAMAFQLGLPIVIFREEGVIEDGVLERGVTGLYLPEFDLSTAEESDDFKAIDKYLETEQWTQVITQWSGRVYAVKQRKGEPPRLY